MSAHTWPSIVTLLTVLLMGWTAYLVGHARSRYGVKAPAMTGDPAFERCYRIQMNTIESSLMFLPLVWLADLYGGSVEIGVAGFVWIAGRVIYAIGYREAAAKRSFGYGVALFALCALLLDVLFRMGRALLLY
jgi:uncharacterized MAPEG superfamily protein